MDEGSTIVTFTKTNITGLGQRAQCVVSKRFHNSENENNTNYKRPDRMKFKFLFLDKVYAGFH